MLARERRPGREGYGLEIGDRVTIAGDDAGVFYGTQTVLQMLRARRGTLPRGEARDWPRFRERGYMLDAGRKYWSPDYVVQTIREMAYLKLNTLQLHLSDNNAFRLVSDRFPYLAAPEAYTKADIRRFEAAARKYHVTIIPEIEMPAHAGAILAVRPDLGLDCLGFGTTLDVTRREVRDFTRALIDEFAPLFSGPEFHIATDEYPGRFHQRICEPLVRYADERGFGSTADVFVDFINEMNTVVRSHGKQTVIWNWWDVDQDPTIAPDTNDQGRGVDHRGDRPGSRSTAPQHYLDLGYEVVASPSDKLYVTPGLRLLPNPKFLYEEWEPLEHPRLDGYLISVWADDAITQPDSSFDTHLRRPREAMADRVWGGPRRGTVADLFARADAIGSPPGVPEHALPGTLTGTPYGTSPAWGDLPNTYDKVFDGDPSTFFDFAEPSGGYTGIDLGAGNASPVALIRFVPRNGQLGRMVGGRFEGCTDGPTSGCRTLATVQDGPVLGWNELAVADTGRYRWLRYVGPDGSFCDVAEIEFVAPSRDVTVQAPAQLRQLDDNRVVTSYRNTSTRPVYDVRLDLSAYATDDRAGRVVRALERAHFAVVQPGQDRVDLLAGGRPAVGGDRHLPPGRARELPAAAGRGPTSPACQRVQPHDARSGARPRSSIASSSISTRASPKPPSCGSPTTPRAPSRSAGPTTASPPTNPGFALAPAQGTLTIPAGDTASATLTASAADDASGASPSPARVDLTAARGAAARIQGRLGRAQGPLVPRGRTVAGRDVQQQGHHRRQQPDRRRLRRRRGQLLRPRTGRGRARPRRDGHPRRADVQLARHVARRARQHGNGRPGDRRVRQRHQARLPRRGVLRTDRRPVGNRVHHLRRRQRRPSAARLPRLVLQRPASRHRARGHGALERAAGTPGPRSPGQRLLRRHTAGPDQDGAVRHAPDQSQPARLRHGHRRVLRTSSRCDPLIALVYLCCAGITIELPR